MSDPFPAHLADAIRERIAVLRQTWDADGGIAAEAPRLRGYPVARQKPRHPRS